MKKMAGFTITILFSSLTLGLIQYLITGAFSQIYLIIVFPFYFFFPLLIFAIPLQYVLNKKPKKFSFVYFLFYLLVSSAANFLLFYLASIPGYPPLLQDLKYISIVWLLLLHTGFGIR